MRSLSATEANGYVTRGEFRQFERRMDDRFDGVNRKLDALHATVAEVVEQDEQGEWFGPRAWSSLRLLAPLLVGGGIAYLVSHFTG